LLCAISGSLVFLLPPPGCQAQRRHRQARRTTPDATLKLPLVAAAGRLSPYVAAVRAPLPLPARLGASTPSRPPRRVHGLARPSRRRPCWRNRYKGRSCPWPRALSTGVSRQDGSSVLFHPAPGEKPRVWPYLDALRRPSSFQHSCTRQRARLAVALGALPPSRSVASTRSPLAPGPPDKHRPGAGPLLLQPAPPARGIPRAGLTPRRGNTRPTPLPVLD